MYERPARGHNSWIVRLTRRERHWTARLRLQSGGFQSKCRSFTCALAGTHREDPHLVVQMIHQAVPKPQEIHTFFVYRDGTTTAAGVNCLHFDTD